MDIGGDSGNAVEAVDLHFAEIPLEIRENFAALDYTPLFFCSYADKLSNSLRVSRRIVIVTLDHMYVCHLNGDILRCVAFADIRTVFIDYVRKQIAFIIPDEFDIALRINDPDLLLHTVQTLHGLHHVPTPIDVEVVRPDASLPMLYNNAAGMMNSVAGGDSMLPFVVGEDDDPLDGSPARSTARQQYVTNLFAPPSRLVNRSLWTRIRQLVGAEPRQHEWFTGPESSDCIGRGYYLLQLKKPAGYVVKLDRKNNKTEKPMGRAATGEKRTKA